MNRYMEAARQTMLENRDREQSEQILTCKKRCSRCKQSKVLNMFGKHHRSWDGLDNYCKLCSRQHQVELRKKNPNLMRSSDLKKKYGITLQDKLDMLAKQGNRCAVCGGTEHHGKYPDITGWHVDHDHATKKVRGLLCKPCNLTLGNCLEDVARLKALIEYLERG
jgi:hypothetical protein